jgi:hypothetical protein
MKHVLNLFCILCIAWSATVPLAQAAEGYLAAVQDVSDELSLADYFAQVLKHDPDIQLAHAKVRETRARQQNAAKKRFLNLFNFINVDTLQGSAENDVKAAEARAEADTQTALLEAGIMALDYAQAHINSWSQVDAVLLAQRKFVAAQLQFDAGKLTRYQRDAAEAEWQQAQNQFRHLGEQVVDKHLRLSANVLTASQLERPQLVNLTLPDLFTPTQALNWAPLTAPACDCHQALQVAVRERPEVAEFNFRQSALARLIKLSKLSQRPVLLVNQQQLLLKKQKFERSLIVEVEAACTSQETLQHTLPTVQQAAIKANHNVQTATQDLQAGRISQLDWQGLHHQWVLAHKNWRQAELQQAQLNWRLRYLMGKLTVDPRESQATDADTQY